MICKGDWQTSPQPRTHAHTHTSPAHPGARAPKGGAWSMRPLRSLLQVGDALSQRKQQAVMREDEIRREDSLSRHVPM